jgi:hypothetical protein
MGAYLHQKEEKRPEQIEKVQYHIEMSLGAFSYE